MGVQLKNLTIAVLTNANVAVYTPVNAGVSAKINAASAYNADSVDRTVDIYIVASGGAGSAGATNAQYTAKIIPAGQSVSLDLLIGKNVMGANGPGSLVAKASVASQITLSVAGIEVF